VQIDLELNVSSFEPSGEESLLLLAVYSIISYMHQVFFHTHYRKQSEQEKPPYEHSHRAIVGTPYCIRTFQLPSARFEFFY